MEKSKLRDIFEYEFRRGTNAAQTAPNINDVYGHGTACERMIRFWFDRFRSGNFDFNNEPQPMKNKDELKAIVDADSSQIMLELAAAFNVSDKSILIHFLQIGKINKLGKWVPYELAEQKQQNRVEAPHNRPSQNYQSYDWKLSVPHHTHQTLVQLIHIFIRNLNNFLQGKNFKTNKVVKNASKEFIDSRRQDFYSRAINELPLKWQTYIFTNDQYFDLRNKIFFKKNI